MIQFFFSDFYVVHVCHVTHITFPLIIWSGVTNQPANETTILKMETK